MSFLKKLHRGARGLLKQASHPLDRLDDGIHFLGKSIHTGQTGYRALKHAAVENIPGANKFFDVLDASPVGMIVSGGVNELQNGLKLASDAVQGGRAAHAAAEGHLNNPALNEFIYN